MHDAAGSIKTLLMKDVVEAACSTVTPSISLSGCRKETK